MKRIGAAGELTFDKLEVLGEVPEGDSVVHVLVRSRLLAGELETESLEVISFKKVGENWKGMLSKKIKGIAAQLRKGFE